MFCVQGGCRARGLFPPYPWNDGVTYVSLRPPRACCKAWWRLQVMVAVPVSLKHRRIWQDADL